MGVAAAAEEALDRGALMQRGYTLVRNAESELPMLSLREPLYLLVEAEDRGFAASVAKRVMNAGARSRALVSNTGL